MYYDVEHFAAIMGQMKAVEYITLQSSQMDRQLIVTVSPDSMKPKDEITVMNQAQTLWQEKAIDLKTLYTILNFPDPQKTAGQTWLYLTNPQLYGQMNFPELTQEIQQFMAQQQGGQPQAQPGQAPPPPGQATGAGEIQTQPEPNMSVPMAGSSLSEVQLPA